MKIPSCLGPPLFLLLAGFLFSCASFAQDAVPGSAFEATPDWTQPRTPWGDPDLQGVWRYEATIPLERPASLAGRASLTAEEIAEIAREEAELSARRLAGLDGEDVGRASVEDSPIQGNEYNAAWQDHGRPRQVFAQTSLIVDPLDGRLHAVDSEGDRTAVLFTDDSSGKGVYVRTSDGRGTGWSTPVRLNPGSTGGFALSLVRERIGRLGFGKVVVGE